MKRPMFQAADFKFDIKFEPPLIDKAAIQHLLDEKDARVAAEAQKAFEDYRAQLIEFEDYRQMLIERMK